MERTAKEMSHILTRVICHSSDEGEVTVIVEEEGPAGIGFGMAWTAPVLCRQSMKIPNLPVLPPVLPPLAVQLLFHLH